MKTPKLKALQHLREVQPQPTRSGFARPTGLQAMQFRFGLTAAMLPQRRLNIPVFTKIGPPETPQPVKIKHLRVK